MLAVKYYTICNTKRDAHTYFKDQSSDIILNLSNIFYPCQDTDIFFLSVGKNIVYFLLKYFLLLLDSQTGS